MVTSLKKTGKRRYNLNGNEIGLDFAVYFITFFVLIVTAYPFIYLFSMSVSSSSAVTAGRVLLYPIGFNVEAYKVIFTNSEIWAKLGNSVWIVVVGTLLNVFATVTAAYPLSRKELPLKPFFSFIITFTMFFSGGMIPGYILIQNLGLMNSKWALVLPMAANAWYIILARTFYKTIPESLIESAKLDGCKHVKIILNIILPLSLPIVAVIVLYGAVYHWNAYFNAMIYITDPKRQPLQLYLYRVLVSNETNTLLRETSNVTSSQRNSFEEQLKYAIIIFTIMPIIGLYPFLQKYFVKGVMVGSIKE